MSDPMDDLSAARLVLPADGQRTFAELQEKFRAANLAHVRATLRQHSVVRYHRDGTVAGLAVTGLMTDAPAGQDHRRVDDWLLAGERPPDFTELERAEFRITEGPGLDRELRDLARDAAAMARHEGVIYRDGNHPEARPADNAADQRGTTGEDGGDPGA